MNQAITSPCIQVCELDQDGFCSGCYRSSDEITQWIFYSEEQRQAICETLKARKEQYLANCFE